MSGQYFQQLQKYLQWQQQKINHLEKKIMELDKEVTELKNKPTTTIERIEYNFDQLKIETLEGTLNIGLTPNVENSHNDLPYSKVIVPQPVPFFEAVRANAVQFLHNEGKNTLQQLATERQYPLDSYYQSLILQDIERQLDDRIQFYSKNEALSENDMMVAVRQDIEQSLKTFVENLSRGE